MVDMLLTCALYDKDMFIAYSLCMWPFYRDHTHLVCVEHDTNIADRHIAHRYADPKVRFALVILVIKYEVMILCFLNLIPFFASD
jgi:hypothetical protein